jgi:autotransporter-associated beta strand protein
VCLGILGFAFLEQEIAMFRTRYRNWVNRINLLGLGWTSTSARRKLCRPPRLEALEDRWAPATHIWSGAGSSALWSNPQNWSSGGVPIPGEANPILQFPAFASHPTNTNDIVGLNILQLGFTGTGYNLGGNAIALTGDTTVFQSFGANRIGLGLNLLPSGLFAFHRFEVVGGTLDLAGQITSPAINTLDVLNQAPSATLRISNLSNNYGGDTLIEAGTLQLSGDVTGTSTVIVGPTGDGTLDLSNTIVSIGALAGAGTVKNGGLITGTNNKSTTFSGIMRNVFDLDKRGTGTFTMTAANAFTGSSLDIRQGTFRMGGNNVVTGTQFVFVSPGATFDLNNFVAQIGSLFGDTVSGGFVTLGSGSLFVNPVIGSMDNFRGTISGTGNLIKEGSDTLTLSGPNTYSGATHITGGTLRLGAANAVPGASAVTVDAGALFFLAGFNDTIASLGGSGNVFLDNVATDHAVLTVNPGNFIGFYGNIGGFGGGLTKSGSGVMILGASSHLNYQGPTVVHQGVLAVDGNVASSPITVDTAAVLTGTGNLASLTNSGTVKPGFTVPFFGTVHGSSFTFNAGSNFQVRLDGPDATNKHDRLVLTGSANLTANPFLNVSLGYTPPPGDFFTILNASGGITGFFRDPATGNVLHQGDGFTVDGLRFQIGYNPTSVQLLRVFGPATQYLVNAVTSSQAGAPFDITVTAADADGNTVNTYAGTVHFLTSDPNGALPVDYTFTQDDSGVHTFAGGATLFKAGSQTILAVDTRTGIVGSLTVLVTPAPAVGFTIDAPASASSGSPFDITVTAQDPYGNTDTNYQGTVTFSSSDTDPGVVLPANYTFTAADAGAHTFTNTGLGETTLITLGDQTVTASDTVSGINGSATVTVTDGRSVPENPPPLTPRLAPLIGPSPARGGIPSQPANQAALGNPLAAPALDAAYAGPKTGDGQASQPFTALALPSDQNLPWLGSADSLTLEALGIA